MSSTFLELTNRVLRQFNEIELTSSNFSTATGFFSVVKDAVNDAAREINQKEIQWPFNHNVTTQVLDPNQADPRIYALPSTTKLVDRESFFLVEDVALDVDEKYLPLVEYNHYLRNYRAKDYNDDNTDANHPDFVYETQGLQFGVYPKPTEAYTIRYEYWAYPDEMSAYDDTTTIPDRFDHVIMKGALATTNLFRRNFEAAQLWDRRFKHDIKQMRIQLINRYDRMRDTRIDSIPVTRHG